jgi:hypothetical protein
VSGCPPGGYSAGRIRARSEAHTRISRTLENPFPALPNRGNGQQLQGFSAVETGTSNTYRGSGKQATVKNISSPLTLLRLLIASRAAVAWNVIAVFIHFLSVGA